MCQWFKWTVQKLRSVKLADIFIDNPPLLVNRGVARNFGKGGGREAERYVCESFDRTPSLMRKVEVHCYNKKRSEVD